MRSVTGQKAGGKKQMKVQKRKLMRIFLVPLLLVVLFQGIMPFFMLMSSGVKDTMESNARDFAFKIKSSPFCKGSIWQNGEFSY